jgi:hypothetical protein
MFHDLYDAVSMLGSLRWPIADGKVTAVDAMRMGKDSAQFSIACDFSINNDGPTPVSAFGLRAALRRNKLRPRFAKSMFGNRRGYVIDPDDPSVNRLDGGVRALLDASVTKTSTRLR